MPVTLYPVPDSPIERRKMCDDIDSRKADLRAVLTQTHEHRHDELKKLAKNVRAWQWKILKLKSIYHTLNMFSMDASKNCMVGEFWCATGDMVKIEMALKRATVSKLLECLACFCRRRAAAPCRTSSRALRQRSRLPRTSSRTSSRRRFRTSSTRTASQTIRRSIRVECDRFSTYSAK